MRRNVLVAVVLALVVLTYTVSAAYPPVNEMVHRINNAIRGADSETVACVNIVRYDFGTFSGPDYGIIVKDPIILGPWKVVITWSPAVQVAQSLGLSGDRIVVDSVQLQNSPRLSNTPYIKYEIYYNGQLIKSGTMQEHQYWSDYFTGVDNDVSISIQTLGTETIAGMGFIEVVVFIQSWWYTTITSDSSGFHLSGFPSSDEYTLVTFDVRPEKPTWYVNGVATNDPDGDYSGSSIKVELIHPSSWNIYPDGGAAYTTPVVYKYYKVIPEIRHEGGVIYEAKAVPAGYVSIDSIAGYALAAIGLALIVAGMVRRV